MPHNPNVLSSYAQAAHHYHDPLLATSQAVRETKPWYVCPRSPWIDGWKFNGAPFFGAEHRRLADNPGMLIQAGFMYGFGWGMNSCIQDMGIERYGTWGAKQQHVRAGHEWAQRRLAFVWTLRPAVLASLLVSSYCIPKELFSQNFGRRNKRFGYDPVPNIVGCAFLFPAAWLLLGHVWARTVILASFTGWSMYDFGHAFGQDNFTYQRENIYPIVMSSHYGLPNKGEGFDGIAGGEHATEWRMESSTESMWLNGKNNVGTSAKYDNHPKFQQEWGHAAYFS